MMMKEGDGGNEKWRKGSYFDFLKMSVEEKDTVEEMVKLRALSLKDVILHGGLESFKNPFYGLLTLEEQDVLDAVPGRMDMNHFQQLLVPQVDSLLSDNVLNLVFLPFYDGSRCSTIGYVDVNWGASYNRMDEVSLYGSRMALEGDYNSCVRIFIRKVYPVLDLDDFLWKEDDFKSEDVFGNTNEWMIGKPKLKILNVPHNLGFEIDLNLSEDNRRLRRSVYKVGKIKGVTAGLGNCTSIEHDLRDYERSLAKDLVSCLYLGRFNQRMLKDIMLGQKRSVL
jgi:hypothetical protein